MAKWEPKHGDRIKRGDQRGTIVSVHDNKGGPNKLATVLPDDRPRSRGAATWPMDDAVQFLGLSTMTCPVCGQRHSIFYCPERI